MKQIIYFLFFLPLISFAQQTEKPVIKHELGVNLFSIKQFEKLRSYDDLPVSIANVNIFPGLYYKRHSGKNALRASFEYTHKNIRNGTALIMDPYSTQYYFSTRNNVAIAAGYERAFGSGKLQPYIFSDFIFNYENLTGSRVNFGCFGPYGIYDFSEEVFEYGMSAGAGLRYSINPVLRLTLEVNAEGFVSVYQDVLNAGEKYRDLGIHINPVNKFGLAVCF